MTDCEECRNRFERRIVVLEMQSENYKKCHDLEMVRSSHLSGALQRIFEIARDNMWFPCSYEDHKACDEDAKLYTGERTEDRA